MCRPLHIDVVHVKDPVPPEDPGHLRGAPGQHGRDVLERRVQLTIDRLQVASLAHLQAGNTLYPLVTELSSLSAHLTPDIEPEACLRFVDDDHMGLQDALPGVLLPPVVVVVLRVHHHSHSVVGGAAGAKSENMHI